MFKSIRKSWDDHKIIKLKIRGIVFKAKKSTFTKYDGYFKTHFEQDDFIYDRKGYIIIDRPSFHFKTILDFMKGKRIKLPESYEESSKIYDEAHFYMLIPLMEMIEEHKKKLTDREEERKWRYRSGSSIKETPQNPANRKYGTSSLPTSNDSDLVTLLLINDAGELDSHSHHCSHKNSKDTNDTCPEPHNSQHTGTTHTPHTTHDSHSHHDPFTTHDSDKHYDSRTYHDTSITPYTSHHTDHNTVSSYEPSHSYSHADNSYSHTSYNDHSSSYHNDYSSSHNDYSSSYNNGY